MVTLKPHAPATKAVPLVGAPKLIVTPLAYQKMGTIIDKCTDEVGWFGTVHPRGAGEFLLKDVFLPKQVTNAATCEIDPEGLIELASQILAMPDGMGLYNSLKLWGHSHVNMGVGASGQDDKQFRELVAESTQQDWYFRLIANKKGEMKVDMMDLVGAVMWEDIPWEIEIPIYSMTELEAIIELNVQRKTYAYPGNTANFTTTHTTYGKQNTVVTKKGGVGAKKGQRYDKRLAKNMRMVAVEQKYSYNLHTQVIRVPKAMPCPTCGVHTFIAVICPICGHLCCPDDYNDDAAMCNGCLDAMLGADKEEQEANEIVSAMLLARDNDED